MNDPLWHDTARASYPDPLPATGHVEVLVVGGGLTGLTTAVLLARAGLEVAVLEARRIGSGTTGASTAKVSLVQGTKVSRIRHRHPLDVVRAYVDANREGLAWLREFCDEHGVAYAARPAGTYAASADQVEAVRDEYAALDAVGLPVRWEDDLDVPFENHGAAILEDQVQLDPMDVVHALAEQVRAHGGSLHEGRRVEALRRDGHVVAELADGGRITADHVVIATGAPSLSGWLLAAKTTPKRSYLLALEGSASVPGMFISAGQPTRSVRTAMPRTAPDVLLVGGSGHVVGRTRSEAARLDDLRRWARQHFPDAVETHAWSAQDYGTPDELPMVGPVAGTDGQIHLASGYDKWGMTNAVAAARAISADLLGKPAGWAKSMQHHPVSPRALATLAGQGLVVGAIQAKALMGAELTSLPSDVPEGSGSVGRRGLRPAAVSHVNGGPCAVSAVCTHLGGILRWNDQEQSWDCPLHGSRFGSDGAVLEGPATKPLTRLERSGHQPAGSGRPSA